MKKRWLKSFDEKKQQWMQNFTVCMSNKKNLLFHYLSSFLKGSTLCKEKREALANDNAMEPKAEATRANIKYWKDSCCP